MPKTKISEFSATPGNNTDIDGINIAEGCAPSGINDAIRELMAQLKDFQAGTAGDSFNGPIGATTPAAGTFTNLSASGTFALTGDQVQISEGGTGQTTANAAFNALAPSQASNAGKYLKTDGTNTSWDALDISTADITGTLPIANGGTGLTALGTGVQTALGQNVTGSGGIVLASSPSLTTPNLGTPSAVTLTNATGLPLSTGVTGTLATTNGGTGLTSFTANRVFYSSSTSAIGSSANLTFDGTTLTANALTTTSTVTINGGTANGVAYLNGSKVLTTGSALSFDGTNLFNDQSTASPVGIRLRNGSTSTSAGTRVSFEFGGSTTGYVGNQFDGSDFNNQYQANRHHIWLNGASETMRLTSTGLGIGTAAPASKLDVNGLIKSTGDAANFLLLEKSANTGVYARWKRPNREYYLALDINNNGGNDFSLYDATAAATRWTVDSSGNLGLGVTPSAWASDRRAYQVGRGGALVSGTAAGFLTVSSNAFWDGSNYKYIATDFATLYAQTSGQHFWSTAASGTAGNAISFTQAMTLDASGNLGVGATAPTELLSLYRAANPYIVLQNSSTGTTSSDGGYLGLDGLQLQLRNKENDAVTFWTNNTERARITSGGNLLVGSTVDSGSRLQVGGSTGSVATPTAIELDGTYASSDGFNKLKLYLLKGASESYGIGLGGLADMQYWAGSSSTGIHRWFTSQTERARITSGGDLLVGTTTAASSTKLDVLSSAGGVACIGAKVTGGATTQCFVAWNTATTGDNVFHSFYTEGGSGTGRGSIDYNRAGGLVRYNITSDYRAKDIIGPVQNTGTTIDALKVYEGVMKGATQSRPMMIAHEAQEVVPFCVSGAKDEINEDGTPKYQQMDHASLVPLLIAELQSLRARVAQLEAK